MTTVWTIGHSNQSMERVLELLSLHQVEVVVDVRSTPYSQYTPHFNREALAASLAQAGVDYRFAGDYLGGRPSDPTCYEDGVVPEGPANYLKLVKYDEVAKRPWFVTGVERVEQLAISRRIALMCSEEDPLRCHRHHLVAQSLMQRGHEVQHIRKSGNDERAQLTPARVEATQQQLALILE